MLYGKGSARPDHVWMGGLGPVLLTWTWLAPFMDLRGEDSGLAHPGLDGNTWARVTGASGAELEAKIKESKFSSLKIDITLVVLLVPQVHRGAMLHSWASCLFLYMLLVPATYGGPSPEKPINEVTTISGHTEDEECIIKPKTLQSVAVIMKYVEEMEQDETCAIDDGIEYGPETESSPDPWILEKQTAKWEKLAGGWRESRDSNSDPAEYATMLSSAVDFLYSNETADLVCPSKNSTLLPLAFILLFLLFNMVTFFPAGAEEGICRDNTQDSREHSGRRKSSWWKRWWRCMVNAEEDGDPPE
ncbi:hypothetical protein SAY86_012881 [Trapa natans]|uniref:Uncharacterized protein n=1 Tax=Trapa natans TaxID=22666 RepID=A0AAN7MAT9_TRANT|nr:hypothetical protein SAY86_012881 [Trapa natans]